MFFKLLTNFDSHCIIFSRHINARKCFKFSYSQFKDANYKFTKRHVRTMKSLKSHFVFMLMNI